MAKFLENFCDEKTERLVDLTARLNVVVKNKRKNQWSWIDRSQNTREIVEFYIGQRSKKSAKKLWQSLPHVYIKCAVYYSDFWAKYSQMLLTF